MMYVWWGKTNKQRLKVIGFIPCSPTLSDEKKTGVFCSDQCTQTASSEIASLKNVTDLLTSTLQVQLENSSAVVMSFIYLAEIHRSRNEPLLFNEFP